MYALQTNIYLTENCTRFCSTCFYNHSEFAMSSKTAIDISNWVTGQYKMEDVREHRVHLLGGEPLLNFDTVLILLDAIEDGKPEFTKEPVEGGYVLFTNGDLLNDSILRELKSRGVKILLNPTNLNLVEIERRIHRIKSICGGCSLAVVADDINLPRLDILANLAVKNHCHIRINRLYDGGRLNGYVEHFKKKMIQVFNILLESDWVMWPNFIMESTYPLWEGEKNPNACGRWFLAIDPNGDIRTCNADLSTKVGSVYTIKSVRDIKFSHRWTAKNLPECQGCEWITWCQGGCPFSRKLAYGTYNKKTPFCFAFKELFPKLFQLKNKWKEKNDESESDKFSHNKRII